MLRRTILLIIFITLFVCFLNVNEAKKRRKVQGPMGMGYNQSTSCRDFSKYARFNPYSVLNEIWFVFFYWAAPRPIQTYRFYIPTANHTKVLHMIFDEKVTIPVNWTARQVLMQDKSNQTWLLVERGDRGQYWSYKIAKAAKKYLIEAQDVRLRQHDNGRLLGLMECKSENLYIMSRIREVPPHNRIQEEAARFGFRARRGKSYLYQGHEWMPIPEADENDFFETVIPQIANDSKNAELSISQIIDQPTEEQRMCNLKKHLSKHKPVDINSTPSCINPQSTDTSKEEVVFDSVRTEKTSSDCARTVKVDSNISVEKNSSDSVKSETANVNNFIEKEASFNNIRVEDFDADKLKTEKATSDNVRTGEAKLRDESEKEVHSDNVRTEKMLLENIRAETQFTDEPIESGSVNKYIEKNFDLQIQLSPKSPGELKPVNRITEAEFTNGLQKQTINDDNGLPSNSGYKEVDLTTKQKNLPFTDTVHDFSDDLTNSWKDIQAASYTAILRPVENQEFIEQKLPYTGYDSKKDSIASSGVLPEKCYKMELMKESYETTPAYVPPIFNEI